MVISHVAAFVFSVLLTIVSGQNPRVLLYAFAISLLFRFLTIWLLSANVDYSSGFQRLVRKITRLPEPGERSRPYRNEKTGEKAGPATYLTGIFTLMFMLGVVISFASGPKFLDKHLFLPEIFWASVIALVYWVDDLSSRSIILVPDQPVPVNFGYNTRGLNFLMAAIFISAFVMMMVLFVLILFIDERSPYIRPVLEWTIFITLALIRFIADLHKALYKKRRLPG